MCHLVEDTVHFGFVPVFFYWPGTHKHPKLAGLQAQRIYLSHSLQSWDYIEYLPQFFLAIFVCALQDQMQDLMPEMLYHLKHFCGSINNLVLHKIMYPVFNHTFPIILLNRWKGSYF